MSSAYIHLIGVAGLAILAGVAGFVIGGVIEMKKHHREIQERRELRLVIESSKPSDKNAETKVRAA